MRPVRPALVLLVALAAACSSRPAAQPEEQVAPLGAHPLAGLAGQQVVVLPVRYLRPADSLGWAAQVGDPRAYLAKVDDEIAFAARDRGAAPTWVWPEEITRLARRNAAYAPDPHNIAADPLRGAQVKRQSTVSILADPLRSQLRQLVALRDARYALVPVELRFEPRGDGTGRAVLHWVVVDARAAQVVMAGDIATDPAPSLTPAIAAGIGERFADLIAAR
ncbi:MAG TPA: hypothetical protein VFS05_07360 [Gemmatimonadaceae bacterium]|nr:hypothetical protein [Gemmatimonadaceae bacterium]